MPHDHEHEKGHGHAGHPRSPAAEHRAAGPASVTVQVITVSDTRDAASDASGSLLRELFRGAGHRVCDALVVKDDAAAILSALEAAADDPEIRVVVLTGGTGVARRDVTVEVVTPLLQKVLPGFGEIFRQLSYQEIGAAAFLSRSLAGVRGKQAVFVLPGSANAVRLATEKLILPEVAHLVRELDK